MKHKHISSAFSTILKRSLNTKPRNESKSQWIQPTGRETDIKIYNIITKTKSPLILKNDFITWYMCGPTLYDSAHIGHACTYVRFDIIKRILTDIFNIDVIQIMGLTDIDDKIIAKSKSTNQDWQQLTKFYEQEFVHDMSKLNVRRPYLSCRVTDYIPEIIQFVSQLIDKNYAYLAKDGSVYFDTLKYPNYGKIGTPTSNDTEVVHAFKKSPMDFALWKASKRGEPFWESPWGNGRPGWHIECSAIASTIFGNNIDIHSGGIDLVFPHHENEEAQSCCYHDTNQWINYWIHSAHLYLKTEKMSKSLQNTISIDSLLKDYTANEFRFLCLLTNYRQGIEFSQEVMNNSVSLLTKLEHFLQSCSDYVSGNLQTGIIDEATLMTVYNETKTNVYNSLRNDFNTGKAMFEVMNLVKVCNKMLHEEDTKITARSTAAVAVVANYVSTLLNKLGISYEKAAISDDYCVEQIVDSYVKFRTKVRNKLLSQANKDVELLNACDQVRKDLDVYGFSVKDHKEQSTWTKKLK